MRRALLGLVLGILSTASVACRSYTSSFLSASLSPVLHAELSIVFVKGIDAHDHESDCTGFVVAPQVIVTAAHCVDGDEAALVDGVAGKRTKVDETVDLALVSAPIVKHSLLLRRSPIRTFESLIAIGYAWGRDRRTVLLETAMDNAAADETHAPGVFVQGGYLPGMSGAPLIDTDGLVVGIVQTSAHNVGYGVGARVIQAFIQ
jgi:S1-C subfamily serine protease